MASNKKTILVFMDWYEPGYKAGGPVRSVANLVNQLKDKFDFKIVTRDTEYTETIPYDGITSDVWTKKEAGVEIYYISTPQLSVKTIKSLIKHTTHDVIYLNSLFSYYFALVPCYYAVQPTILSVRGMLSQGALGVKSKKKSLFLRAAKVIGLFKNVTFLATSEDEKRQIQTHFKRNDIAIAENIAIQPVYKQFEHLTQKKPGELRLFFLGRVAREKNTHAAIQLVNQIDDNYSVSLDIFGAIYDPEYYEFCQALINESPEHITITYKGVVKPHDLSQSLTSYHALLFPTTGENFGHAIIESLLNKKPVIISDKTPWTENEVIRVCELHDSDSFINEINHLLGLSDRDYAALSEKAWEYGKQQTESRITLEKYIQLFNRH